MGKNTKTPRSFRFSEAELKLLDRLSDRFSGDKTKTIVAGLRALAGQNEISRETLLAEIERRLR